LGRPWCENGGDLNHGGSSAMAKFPASPSHTMTSYSELKLHIDGEWIGAGSRRTHRVINPANGATLGELPLVDTADLDRALQAADRGYRLWKKSTAEERGRVLKGAANLIRQRVEHIGRGATLEEGKTLPETRIGGGGVRDGLSRLVVGGGGGGGVGGGGG